MTCTIRCKKADFIAFTYTQKSMRVTLENLNNRQENAVLWRLQQWIVKEFFRITVVE
jgi:hypothetical protein